jgi:hypothetical protein
MYGLPWHIPLDGSVEEILGEAALNMNWPQSLSKPINFHLFRITQSVRCCVPAKHDSCSGLHPEEGTRPRSTKGKDR